MGYQTPRAGQAQHYYEIASDEDPADKSRFSLAGIVCTWEDVEKQYAIKILSETLAGSNEAPLKKAILDKGLAQNLKCTCRWIPTLGWS